MGPFRDAQNICEAPSRPKILQKVTDFRANYVIEANGWNISHFITFIYRIFLVTLSVKLQQFNYFENGFTR